MSNIEVLGFDLAKLLTPDSLIVVARVSFLIFIVLPLIMLFSKWVKSFVTKKYDAQHGMISGKATKYVGFVIVFITVLNEFGFSLSPLLGAAGIVGIAVGFASQTSVSNIISGLFLIAEKPFEIGDLISVGDTTGFVLSIDLLSVKLRKFDNSFVRLPNETIIKSQVTNVTRFSIRRVDVSVSVAYKENIPRVREILKELANDNPYCLQEPEPVIVFSGFGDSSINLMFGIWVAKENFLMLKNSIQEEIKAKFEDNGVEIPFPHLSLYTGSETKPFPVQIVNND